MLPGISRLLREVQSLNTSFSIVSYSIRRAEPHLSYSYKPMDMSRAKYKSCQLYGTYYSILEADDRACALARAIQVFAPGIPQVYCNGLLCAPNDLYFDPADPHSINRPNYTAEETEARIRRPIVRFILELLRLRNTHPAFDGEPFISDTPENRLLMTWTHGEESAVLDADLRTHGFDIRYTENGQNRNLTFTP